MATALLATGRGRNSSGSGTSFSGRSTGLSLSRSAPSRTTSASRRLPRYCLAGSGPSARCSAAGPSAVRSLLGSHTSPERRSSTPCSARALRPPRECPGDKCDPRHPGGASGPRAPDARHRARPRRRAGRTAALGIGERVAAAAAERLEPTRPRGAFVLGMAFALAFCPTLFLLFFGLLIPLTLASAGGLIFPALFALGTAAPLLALLGLGLVRISANPISHSGSFRSPVPGGSDHRVRRFS